MRYDKTVYFIKETKFYNIEKGDHEISFLKHARMANVNDLGADSMNLVFGKITQGALTIRLKSHFREPFDHIEYKGKVYLVKMVRNLAQEQIFIVEERQ